MFMLDDCVFNQYCCFEAVPSQTKLHTGSDVWLECLFYTVDTCEPILTAHLSLQFKHCAVVKMHLWLLWIKH